MDEEINVYEEACECDGPNVTCDCKAEEAYDSREEKANNVLEKLTDEEYLEKFRKELEHDLTHELARIELDAKKRQIQEEFNAKHADDIKKIDEYHQKCAIHVFEDSSDDFEELSQEEVDKFMKRYKECEARQQEILRISTSKEELSKYANVHKCDFVEEYHSLETLKLRLVDIIRNNIFEHQYSTNQINRYPFSHNKERN